jgi:hypothetical protein
MLSLPAGLTLAPNQTAMQSVPSVSAGGEATFNWSVKPTGTVGGRLTYSVSVSAEPGIQGVSVAREIDIPALPTHGINDGLQMVSFPYVFDDRTPSAALGLNPALFDLIRWNPASSVYEAAEYINPGEGYWLRSSGATTLNLVGTQQVKTPTGWFQQKLTQNWNQIGNPFLLAVRWGDARVITTDVGDPDYLKPLTVEEASHPTRQWMSASIFWYDPLDRMYKFDQDFGTEMLPFVGYWVKALKPTISLLLPAPASRAAGLTGGAGLQRIAGAGWSLRLSASDGQTTDGWNFIGMTSSASDGYDAKDAPKPPAVDGAVSLAVVREDLGRLSGRYAQDLRSLGGRKQWDVIVSTPAANGNVNVSWPDIARVPKSYELVLTDVATGRRYPMRQASSVRVNTGVAGSTRLVVVAEPRSGGGALRITSWSVAPSRAGTSAAISVGTSVDSSLSVRVNGADGRLVRALVGRAATSNKATTVTWDYRDNKGVSVPAGPYTVELRASSSDGQKARVVVPLVVTR